MRRDSKPYRLPVKQGISGFMSTQISVPGTCPIVQSDAGYNNFADEKNAETIYDL
jgi:hypothetical protein